MAETISIGSSLSISNADPVDRRTVLSKAEMLAMKSAKMPRSDITKYYALCTDDNQFYIYDKDAAANEDTGKFRLMTTYTPPATEDTAGSVRSCSDTDSITVNSDGTMSVNQISVDKLTDAAGTTLVLDGGSAPVPEES